MPDPWESSSPTSLRNRAAEPGPAVEPALEFAGVLALQQRIRGPVLAEDNRGQHIMMLTGIRDHGEIVPTQTVSPSRCIIGHDYPSPACDG